MLNLFSFILFTASPIFSFCMLVKKPSLPAFIPNMGTPESFTYVMDLNIVPSPPTAKT